MTCLLDVAVLLLAFGCQVHATSEELAYAVVKSASEGALSLSLEAAPFADYPFNTRGFDGGVPGPTFRMNPGETLEIVLTNNLLDANNLDCANNLDFCETAITNLHTHGLHVSSKGRRDNLDYYSDDVMAEVAPGGSETFKFAIPDYHMPGTHWYHPHHHHATALQAGGGAAGVLIVNDPAGYLPDVYANMPERILMLSGHNLQTLQDMAQAAQSNLLESALDLAEANNLPTNVFLVNGQRGPQMSIDSNQWYRFRMVYAAVEQSLLVQETDSTNGGTCTFQLMAKDGVYLHSFPRAVDTLHMFPGARADVAVSCSCDAYPCTVTLGSATRRLRRRRLQRGGGMGDGGQGPDQPGAGNADVDLMILSISSSASTLPDLPTTEVQRPCYLVDLRNTAVPAGQSGGLNLDGGGRAIRWNNDNSLSMTYANVLAETDGDKYAWPAVTTMQTGLVYEMDVTGAHAHPFHQHINPYQITSFAGSTTASYGDGYFQVGDWHDTLLVDDLGAQDVLTVRFQTDVFTGKQVLHCHILEHEDEGMMGYIEITGTEGATWSGAEAVDSQCLRSAFVTADTTATTTATMEATTAVTATTTTMEATTATAAITTTITTTTSTVCTGCTTSDSAASSATTTITTSTATTITTLTTTLITTTAITTTATPIATPTSATGDSDTTATTAATTTTTTPIVVGSVTFDLNGGNADAFVSDFDSDMNGEVGTALRTSIASVLDGVSPVDVRILDVNVLPVRRLGNMRVLTSQASIQVDYEIILPATVAETQSVVEVSTALENSNAATALATSLNQELTTFVVSDVQVTAAPAVSSTTSVTTTGASSRFSAAALRLSQHRLLAMAFLLRRLL